MLQGFKPPPPVTPSLIGLTTQATPQQAEKLGNKFVEFSRNIITALEVTESVDFLDVT